MLEGRKMSAELYATIFNSSCDCERSRNPREAGEYNRSIVNEEYGEER